MRIENEIKLDFDDVLFRPKRSTLSSRKMVELERTFTFGSNEYTIMPIIAANMDGVGTFKMAKSLKKFGMLTALRKFYREDQLVSHFNGDYCSHTIYTLGTTIDDYDKFKKVNGQTDNVKWVCVDVANGYSESFIDFVTKFRDEFPDKILMAGNVVTPDITEELILKGVDIVKIGIGGGSVCTTRLKAGVGIPQLSAVNECSDAAHGLNAHIISDGGCKTPGDVAKAFGGGADFVMLGGMLAGTVESEVIPITTNGTDWIIKFYGMSSEYANNVHYGSMSDYKAAEGKMVTIPFRGEVKKIIKEIIGGLRSTCTYVGARRLKALPKCTTFIRVNNTHNRIFEKNDD